MPAFARLHTKMPVVGAAEPIAMERRPKQPLAGATLS
jgi:hypothetical protein